MKEKEVKADYATLAKLKCALNLKNRLNNNIVYTHCSLVSKRLRVGGCMP